MAARHWLIGAPFTRRTDNLLGLLKAHFEEEEHVLLPILERQPAR